MSPTFTITEREREVILEALKFLTDLLSGAAPPADDLFTQAAPSDSAKPAPAGVESGTVAITARIWKAEPGKTVKGDSCLRVHWGTQPAQPGHGRETYSATCFDTKYFPALTSAVQSGRTIKFVVKRRGNFLNIVSVVA